MRNPLAKSASRFAICVLNRPLSPCCFLGWLGLLVTLVIMFETECFFSHPVEVLLFPVQRTFASQACDRSRRPPASSFRVARAPLARAALGLTEPGHTLWTLTPLPEALGTWPHEVGPDTTIRTLWNLVTRSGP
jgi:hypothetical protein